MNSLVVLFSVLALAAAKPGFLKSDIIGYAAPTITLAPAAVSQQSRLDIKSSPAIIATEAVAPLTRTVIAEPAVVAAPTGYSAPIAYSAPAAIVAHSAYAAPLAVATPAAVSSQSRVDIKSSPAVINTYAGPVALAADPITYSAPIPATYTSSIYAPAIAPAVPIVKTIAINPVAPINIANLPVAPTETPEVAAARAAHLEAKEALEETHKIQKRSVGFVATAPVIPSYSTSPVISSYAGSFVYPSPVARVGTPIAVSAPVLTSAYGIHPY
ncbi:unnamed protein product [Euphydryas editha]|uniref:Cuticle protein n=1 Tax=Euphydryas editha TaxID=104508 RepID=A0AAU9TZG3_EUPED|nr:unnamed protein product [Euphydryas editha]